MKKSDNRRRAAMLLFLSFFLSTALQSQVAWSVMDTLSRRMAGPGVTYTQVFLPAVPVNAYILEVDLENPYLTVETMQGGNQVGKTEALTKASVRMSGPRHQCIGGINGNFWIVPVQNYPAPLNGMPHSGSMRLGEMVSDPNDWNRGRTTDPVDILEEIGFAVIDEAKKIWVDDMVFDGKVSIPEKGEYAFDNVNRIRYNDKLVFFNSYVGAKTRVSDVTGTEVFVIPAEGETWGTSRDVTCTVSRITRGMGEEAILAGESVLSGAGLAAEFLDQLKEGDRVVVNMGLKTRRDGKALRALEMLTGNALVMKEGRLTIRNYNEEYNSMLYPRTGIGQSADGKKLFLIVMDRKTPSKGASTEVMCEILRKAGAVTVCSLDGGGSAQMMLGGKIVNFPGDGSERAVANGWMLFHSAPDDEQVVKVAFADREYTLPKNASYAPVMLGYNQYDVLIDTDFKGCSFSCDPQLGEIRGNALIVSGTGEPGSLTASYGDCSVTKKITPVDSEIYFALDSIIVDTRTNQPVAVRAASSELVHPVDPASLAYTVDDPEICRVENGRIVALSNGETLIHGTLGETTDVMKVKVQIPEREELNIITGTTPEDWVIKASTNLKNPETSILSTGLNFKYTYSSGRAPYIQIAPNEALYGLPDTIKILLNCGEMEFTKLNLCIQKNNGSASYVTTYENVGGDYAINIPTDLFISSEESQSAFPLRISYIQGYLKTTNLAAGQDYNLLVKKIGLRYNDLSTALEAPEWGCDYSISPNPVNGGFLYIRTPGHPEESVQVRLYALSGGLLRQQSYQPNSGTLLFDTRGVLKGTYLLQVQGESGIRSFKVIIP